MKKLFALVLVLALALAIAAPAFAATGWDALPTTTPTHKDFAMVAEKYEFYASTSGGYEVNGTYFKAWDDSKGIVRDTLGRVYFEAVIPNSTDAAALYPGVNFNTLEVAVKLTNVKSVGEVVLTASPVVYEPALVAIPSADKGVFEDDLTVTLPLTANAQTLKAMYTFAAASAADVVATISITAGDTELPANFMYKGVTIAANNPSATSYTFTVGATDYMTFETDGTGKIVRVYLFNDVTNYQVLVDVNGIISFKNGTLPAIQANDGGALYSTLKARYDFFMGALGFAWDGTVKYMTEELIVLNLIDGASGSASVKFPAGFQSIVDPTVQPPQTGDATTVVGFVMIALALVAAAAVTVKKVRA